jgi:hypothetical protein
MTELRALLEQEPGFNTTKLNQHPICVLFSSKIASLTRSESTSVCTWAFNWKPGDVA